MTTFIKINEQTYNITHIGTKVKSSNHLYSAGYPLFQIWFQSGGAHVVVLRTKLASEELVVALNEFVPDNLLDLVLKDTVSFNSAEGKKIQRLVVGI